MTFYELVKLIEESRDLPINEQLIEILSKESPYEGNSKIRLSNHVVDFVSYRINNAFNEFIFKSDLNNKDTINMGLLKIKKEIAYCYKLAKINLLSNISDNFVKSLDDYIDNAFNEIKKTFADLNDSEILMIINSINLKEGL